MCIRDRSFNLSLAVNSAPTFSNLENIQSSLEPGSTFSTNVTWQDPEEDQINFSVNESFDWFEWDTFGNITAAPDSGDLGQYDLNFSISDGCYTTTSTKQTIKSTTVNTTLSFDASYNNAFIVGGAGIAYRNHIATSNSYADSETGDTTVSFTNSFTLGDDEPGDGFSFQVFSFPLFLFL